MLLSNYNQLFWDDLYFTKAQKVSIRKHNHCMLKNFEELLVSQKPLNIGMCLQCVRCRWVGWKAKTKTASNQSKNLTKFSEIKKIRKKNIQQENFSSLKNCTLEVEVYFYLHFYWLISKLEDELKINLNCA